MRSTGFTLLEAAVAVAVAGILAGMMAPLALQAIRQRQEQQTRQALRTAFEAMFGARDRRVANMRADFGFAPPRSFEALPFLVSRCWDRTPPYGRHDGAAFPWGWNGPYWQGPVADGLPVDAWGQPIRLIHDEARGTWQVHSLGADRVVSDDDLHYPEAPASVASYQATVLVVITRTSAPLAGTVTLRHGGNGQARLLSHPVPLQPAAPVQSVPFQAPAGVMELVFTPSAGAFQPFTVPMDLQPGETREVRVNL